MVKGALASSFTLIGTSTLSPSTNATIMGGDTVVGASSTVGANVFLTHSVPPHSLVVSEDVKVKVMDKLAHKAATVDFQI